MHTHSSININNTYEQAHSLPAVEDVLRVFSPATTAVPEHGGEQQTCFGSTSQEIYEILQPTD